MLRNILIFNFILVVQFCEAQLASNQSPRYPELIELYKSLAAEHDEIELYEMGPSDYGLPIYLCVLNGAKDSLLTFQKAKSETTVLINNGIHAGEPDGINACLQYIENWIEKGKKTEHLPVIAIIPAYNVGGMMNRSGTSRANQNGPEEYGFRGNAKNLDLNRDFIKMDSKNMQTFAKIYHGLDPDVFLDTHVSNGADYQYTLTYISPVRERMSPSMSRLLYDNMIPAIAGYTQKNGFDLIPYVNLKGETPEEGIEFFDDLPRYASGYGALFNALSFTIETHMLKPFDQRVEATLRFIEGTIEWTCDNKENIEDSRIQASKWDNELNYFTMFERTNKRDSILFKGYDFTHAISDVTGLKRLKYHRNQPYEKYIPFYHSYEVVDSVQIPKKIIIGGECARVIRMLEMNGIKYSRVNVDAAVMGYQQKVISFETTKVPYENHYLHSKVKVEIEKGVFKEKKGNIIIDLAQGNKRFIMSVLYAASKDSYFAWNYFDSYLQQKEYFSPYVFEDKAVEILDANPELKVEFEKKKESDDSFASNAWAQLMFIYKRSEYYEQTVNILPVYFSY